MSDFSGLLSSDYGFKPSGKSAPMSNSSSSSSSKNPTFDLGSTTTTRSTTSNSFNDRDSVFGAPKPHDFENIFGGSARFSSTKSSAAAESFDLDSMYGDSGLKATTTADSGPVFDKPVYDDDIFDGVAGLKSSTANDIFSTVSSPPSRTSTSGFDDLLGGFGKAEPPLRPPQWSSKSSKGVPGFDDLLPGFGGSSSPQTERPKSESNWPPETSTNATKSTSKGIEDPFGVAEQYNDPLEEMSRLSNSGSLNADSSSVDNGRAFDDLDPFDGLGKSVPAFSSGRSYRGKDTGNLRADTSTNNGRGSTSKESTEKSSVRSPDNHQSQKKVPVSNPWDSHQTLFDMPSVSADSYKSSGQAVSPPSYVHVKDANVQPDRSPISEGNLDSSDNDIWLTVSEIPLMTQPTSAPPPSRPPPPRSVQVSKPRMGSPSTNSRKKASESSTQFVPAPKSATAAARGSGVSSVDELEDFAMGKSQSYFDEHANGHSGEDLEMNSVADAMKEAMDRAEAKFRQAKERGSTKSTRSKEAQEKEKERLHTENEEEDMEQRRREKEREAERVWEEKEREQRKLEKERERSRERDMARQAVERATREARERAAAEAQLKAERAKAERAAVDRANAEARQRAEKAAVQRVQNEARERAAAEAKERAERAAAEARERANAEAKEREAAARTRSERAAVERAAAEAHERAAAEARERAAAARANQQRNETDLDDFFSAGRPSSAPRPRANSSDPFSAPFQNRQEPEVPKTSRTTSSNIKKASSTTNIADDLTSIFSAAPSSDRFQEVEGETDERRRARLERHQRTKERTEKAIAEKNERDLQVQRDQAERDRISQTLDGEIKRWAAGKEGNLRALLSTLQYVLWPQCGWQPVSLTDMISAAQVKKVYRKATLCIHPDKVQQKGANLQQKYVAEKVFDLLKEAWNKFNSEELF